jgi:hypothetical protein
MVARGIYADWLDDHGEAETAAKFRDPRDGGLLLSLLPEPVWHPPMATTDPRFDTPYLNFIGPFNEDFCLVLQNRRCILRSPNMPPVFSETLDAYGDTFSIMSVGGSPWIDWALGSVRLIRGGYDHYISPGKLRDMGNTGSIMASIVAQFSPTD